MPYSKAPSVSTYESKRITLDYDFAGRNGTNNYDAYLENFMVEYSQPGDKEKQEVFLKPRPGCVNLTGNYSANSGRGVYAWQNASGAGFDIIYIVGNGIYSYNNGPFTPLFTMATSTGTIGFTEYITSVGVSSLVISDGTNLYQISRAYALTTITSAQGLPSPHLPYPIFMDGYLFVAKSGTGDIYNCNLDNPFVWSAGDFISAEMYPDSLACLSKNNNYLYAVGQESIEYFYDAGNPTGTPLQRVQGAVQQMGTPAPNTVIQTEKEVILVGTTGNGGYTVWALDGFKATEIGTAPVRQRLATTINTYSTTVSAMCIRTNGQKLYIIALDTQSLVYSFDTKQWTFWTTIPQGSTTPGTFFGVTGTNGNYGSAYIQGTNGAICQMGISYTTDNNANTFTCNAVTSRLDFGTINKKTMSRLTLMGGEEGSSYHLSYNISWNDTDYLSTSWTTPVAVQFINDFPAITQLGIFRRRAFKLSITPSSISPSPVIFRIDGMEVDINKGTQ